MNDGNSLKIAFVLFDSEGKNRNWLARKLGCQVQSVSGLCSSKAWIGNKRERVAELFGITEMQFSQLSVPPREYVRDGVKA